MNRHAGGADPGIYLWLMNQGSYSNTEGRMGSSNHGIEALPSFMLPVAAALLSSLVLGRPNQCV